MDTPYTPGDLLYRHKGLVDHVGVYLGNDKVLHTSPSNGVEVISVAHFANNQSIRYVATCVEDQAKLSQRLSSILGGDSGYHASKANCEHLANYLVRGRAYSPQKRAMVLGALSLGLPARKAGTKYWPLFAILGAVCSCITWNQLPSHAKKPV